MSIYLKDTESDYITVAFNASQPRMTGTRASWDSFSITIEDEKCDAWLDTTWGRYMYFEHQGKWYKLPPQEAQIGGKTKSFWQSTWTKTNKAEAIEFLKENIKEDYNPYKDRVLQKLGVDIRNE